MIVIIIILIYSNEVVLFYLYLHIHLKFVGAHPSTTHRPPDQLDLGFAHFLNYNNCFDRQIPSGSALFWASVLPVRRQPDTLRYNGRLCYFYSWPPCDSVTGRCVVIPAVDVLFILSATKWCGSTLQLFNSCEQW